MQAYATLISMLAPVSQSGSAPQLPAEPISPAWIVAIIAVSAIPAFLILHLIVTTLLLGKTYVFPLKFDSGGPTYCPNCGKHIDRRPEK